MNQLRQVLGVVERVEGDVVWVHDADGVVRPGPNDLKHDFGDTVKLVLDEGGSVIRVLDT